jgi:dTDP-4-amino-4,6-dideoxygalactose transaminase
MSQVPFFEHDLGELELRAVAEVLKGPILTTGETVSRFEKRFAEYLGCKHAVGVTSCTGALHISLLALGIGPGDEVITTPMTFVASSSAIIETGAKPVFVDVEPDTGLLDVERVHAAITERTRAILPVHLYGLMCDMRALRALADDRGLYLVEDAAHCVEGARDGIRPGQLGDTVCFSFYATKALTCGEGGAVATNDAELAGKLRLLRHHGMTRTAADQAREGYQHWDMKSMGWKYNMDNIQAALLMPQLDRLEENCRKRTWLCERYAELLANVPGVSWPKTHANTKHAHHLFPIWVAPVARDRLIQDLSGRGISAVVNYRPIHLLSYFRQTFGFEPGNFPSAERIGASTVSLPMYPKMPLENVDRVAGALRHLLECGRSFG